VLAPEPLRRGVIDFAEQIVALYSENASRVIEGMH
jgi:hypothetical protein